MLNSADYEIFSANKYKTIVGIFILAETVSCSAMLSRKDFAIVGNFTLLARQILRSAVEQEKSFITSGPVG